jgi:hypothetical protein
MAITMQPYPTMADLRAPRARLQGGELGAFPFDDLLDQARRLGMNLPRLPANATPQERLVYQLLVNLALTEARLREGFLVLSNLIQQGKPVSCALLRSHNQAVDDFRDMAKKVVENFDRAKLGSQIQRRPVLPPRFDLDARCSLQSDVLGQGLGELGFVPILWGVAILIVAVGAGIVVLALNWDDIARSHSASSIAANHSEVLLAQAKLSALMVDKCGSNADCLAAAVNAMPNTIKELTKESEALTERSSRGFIWWAGLIGLVGLAGAGAYAYKNRKG